jgi:hypothetical protein
VERFPEVFMGPPLYLRSVVDRNVVMRRMTVRLRA